MIAVAQLRAAVRAAARRRAQKRLAARRSVVPLRGCCRAAAASERAASDRVASSYEVMASGCESVRVAASDRAAASDRGAPPARGRAAERGCASGHAAASEKDSRCALPASDRAAVNERPGVGGVLWCVARRSRARAPCDMADPALEDCGFLRRPTHVRMTRR